MKQKIRNITTIVKQTFLPPYQMHEAPVLLGAAVLLLTLVFTIVAISTDTNTRSQAATANSVEPESGVSSGNVTVVSDANASGGKYIKFDAISLPTVTSSPTTRPTPSVAIQPISWWKNLYDSNWASQNSYYLPLTKSVDSWDYYNAAYGIDGPVAMYRATGDTKYLDQALVYANNMVNSAKPSSSLGSSAFGDAYLGWISQRSDVQGQEVPLFESYAWRYVTNLLLVIKQTPTLYTNPTYKSQYDKLLTFTEVNIFDKWYSRGVNSYIYRSRTHMAAHWAYISMDLLQMTTDTTRLTKEQKVFDDINNHLPNYNNASLHGQMIQSPVNAAGYFWSDVWGSFSRPGQDVAHGNNLIAYLVEAHDLGKGGWTDMDLQKITVTFDKVIWPSATTYADFVDGSGTGTGWFPEGFAKLGRYNAALQKRIEGITGEGIQFYGNGALNAKLLGSPN